MYSTGEVNLFRTPKMRGSTWMPEDGGLPSSRFERAREIRAQARGEVRQDYKGPVIPTEEREAGMPLSKEIDTLVEDLPDSDTDDEVLWDPNWINPETGQTYIQDAIEEAEGASIIVTRKGLLLRLNELERALDIDDIEDMDYDSKYDKYVSDAKGTTADNVTKDQLKQLITVREQEFRDNITSVMDTAMREGSDTREGRLNIGKTRIADAQARRFLPTARPRSSNLRVDSPAFTPLLEPTASLPTLKGPKIAEKGNKPVPTKFAGLPALNI